jgi:hypothetical protein
MCFSPFLLNYGQSLINEYDRIMKDRYAVVIMDRAAWHTTGKIKCFDNIIPMPLPP